MSKRKKIWMVVDSTRYHLPVAVADTAVELAKIVGVSPQTIRESVRKPKSKYLRIEIKEDETDGNGDSTT